MTGFGADFLCIDDPLADRAAAESPTIRQQCWEWYTDCARTRLHPNAAQLVCATRWHEADLTGRLIENMPGDWVVLSLPAICDDAENDALHRKIGAALWPARFPKSELPTVEKGEISSRSFASLYQQRPVPAEGNMIKTEWIQTYHEAPSRDKMRVVFAIDPAAKTATTNDETAVVELGVTDNAFLCFECAHWPMDVSGVLRVVTALAADKPEAIYIEDTSNGIAVIQTLQAESTLPVIACKVRGSKESRVDAVTRLFEARKVYFPAEAPWLVGALEQILKFPSGKRDDIVDALTLALERTAEVPIWLLVHRIFDGALSDGDDDQLELEKSEEEVERRLKQIERDEELQRRLAACGGHVGKLMR